MQEQLRKREILIYFFKFSTVLRKFTPGTIFYSSAKLYKLVSAAAFRTTSIEDIARERAKPWKSPHPATVRSAVLQGAGDLGSFATRLSQHLHMIVRRSGYLRKLRREKVVILIDEHDETFSSKTIILNGKRYTLINRKKLQVLRYASLAVVGKAGKPVTLAILPVYKGQSRAETVRILLQIIAPLGLKLDYLLMDGGFASAELFEELDNRSLKWICRGKWSKKITPTDSNFLQEIGKVKYQVRSFLGSDGKTLLPIVAN